MVMTSSDRSVGRRRVLTVLAGLPVMAAGLAAPARRTNAGAPAIARWTGSALGADAGLQVAHPDARVAAQLVASCRQEIERIERLFSLYRPDSALARLNRTGTLNRPPADFRLLLNYCRQIFESTAGAFDPTVQPLWEACRDHFSAGTADEAALDERLARARRLTGFQHVQADDHATRFARDGMAVTLNGIAQGFLTDRIAALLRRHGVTSALVETGETYGLGQRPDGSGPWRIGLAAPGYRSLSRIVSLSDSAVATSAPDAARFDREGRYHHLFDPATGRPSQRYRSASVIAPTAWLADGFSTAFSTMSRAEIEAALARHPGTGALLIDRKGRQQILGDMPI